MIPLACLLFISGCGGTKETVKRDVSAKEKRFRIVVYPLENLSGNPIPRNEIRQSFVDKLGQAGLDVIGEEGLRRFMAKNRIRYTGGLDRATAKALKDDLGADGVLIVSVELYFDESPPKVALISRLVMTGEKATIAWIDGVGLAGDDSPGILELGLIEDPMVLLEKAVQSLVDSLEVFLSGGKEGTRIKKVPRRYQPRIVFRSPLLETDRKYTVAVVPFFNTSERRSAGEIVVLHFVRQLKRFENFEIIEPGIIRQEFLSLRIIMEDGISLAQSDAVFSVLEADLVLSGKVMDYRDYKSAWGKAKVDFSSQLIERKSRMVVWSSMSYNDGEEGVYFFDWGKVNTAHGLTKRMIQSIGERIVKEEIIREGIEEPLPAEEPIFPAPPPLPYSYY
jgi:TolB-like protein